MKKFGGVLALVVLAGVIWFVWLKPGGDEATESEPATEVAVHLGKITRATLRAYVTAYGVVEPEPAAGDGPAASASVAPSVPGVVVEVKGVEGQHVAKGDVLFQLDSRAADVAADFAGKTVDREKQLLKIEGTSEKSVQDAEQQLDAARVQQALLRVQSPLAGTITRVNVKPGEAVDLTTVMATVVDLGSARRPRQRAEPGVDGAQSGPAGGGRSRGHGFAAERLARFHQPAGRPADRHGGGAREGAERLEPAPRPIRDGSDRERRTFGSAGRAGRKRRKERGRCECHRHRRW